VWVSDRRTIAASRVAGPPIGGGPRPPPPPPSARWPAAARRGTLPIVRWSWGASPDGLACGATRERWPRPEAERPTRAGGLVSDLFRPRARFASDHSRQRHACSRHPAARHNSSAALSPPMKPRLGGGGPSPGAPGAAQRAAVPARRFDGTRRVNFPLPRSRARAASAMTPGLSQSTRTTVEAPQCRTIAMRD
jgi:hypothetical protein